MFIRQASTKASESRLDFDPAKLDKKLGDGHRTMSAAQQERRHRQLLQETRSAARADQLLERIVGGNDLDSINYLSKGLVAARSVCRIQLKDANARLIGYASGFLIGPGVLLTNHHVFGTAADAVNSLADFDYELDVNGRYRPVTRFGFDPGRLFYANLELDYAVVAVKPQSIDGGRGLVDWGWLHLSGEPGKADLGDYLTIIQHPAGEPKQVCVRENKVLKYTASTVWYLTDTLGGSSGAPVMNRFWQVVALHHSGVPKKNSRGQWLLKDGRVATDPIDESKVDWVANEGIRVSSLVRHLQTAMGTHAMIQAALSTPAPVGEATGNVGGGRQGMWVEQNGETASLVVPLRIPVEWVRNQVAVPVAAPAVVTGEDTLVEAVHIDQATLGTRPGYLPNFLGKGTLSVPLPKIPAKLKSQVAMRKDKPGASELKYFNYSVVMNKDRKLAFFSAVNIDGNKQQDVGKREGDTWLRDPRIEDAFQIDNDFYGKQKSFEATTDRTKNPFDRGHLVRRMDATWGSTVDEAKEHGDDSFHFTNCSPQFFQFNQGTKLWLGLEEFVLGQVVEGKRKACVMNGPVFDGPLGVAGGAGKKDPTFGGVSIPKYFWKLMVIESGGKLQAAAFLLSQQDQVMGIDRIHESAMFEKLTAAEAKVFQISVADLAKLTKLDFGKLSKVDTQEATRSEPRRIESLEDIRLNDN